MANSIVRTYKPKDISFIISGFEVGGFTNISVTLNPEVFKLIRGIGGDHARVKVQDKSADIQIQFLQTSVMNDMFSDILNTDIAQQGGRLEIQLKDRSGSTLITSSDGFIVGWPRLTYSDGLNARTWTIKLMKCEAKVGGNATALPDTLGDAIASLF